MDDAEVYGPLAAAADPSALLVVLFDGTPALWECCGVESPPPAAAASRRDHDPPLPLFLALEAVGAAVNAHLLANEGGQAAVVSMTDRGADLAWASPGMGLTAGPVDAAALSPDRDPPGARDGIAAGVLASLRVARRAAVAEAAVSTGGGGRDGGGVGAGDEAAAPHPLLAAALARCFLLCRRRAGGANASTTGVDAEDLAAEPAAIGADSNDAVADDAVAAAAAAATAGLLSTLPCPSRARILAIVGSPDPPVDTVPLATLVSEMVGAHGSISVLSLSF